MNNEQTFSKIGHPYLENELELKYKQIESKTHIRLSLKLKDNEDNRIQCTDIR